MFNVEILVKVRQENGFRQADLARLLGISKSYLSMLENGSREPSMEIIHKLADVTGIPAGALISASSKEDVVTNTANTRNRLNREYLEHQQSKERIWELERLNRHSMAKISMYKRFGDIMFENKLSKHEKNEKLEELMISAMADGELEFEEIRDILRLERSASRNVLNSRKTPYKCQFTNNEIMASSPGEAGLSLRCADCIKFDSGECLGYGDENPRNIIELLERLKIHGIYDATEQSCFLEKYHDFSISAKEIINIRYKAKNGLPIPDDIFYMDTRKRTD